MRLSIIIEKTENKHLEIVLTSYRYRLELSKNIAVVSDRKYKTQGSARMGGIKAIRAIENMKGTK